MTEERTVEVPVQWLVKQLAKEGGVVEQPLFDLVTVTRKYPRIN